MEQSPAPSQSAGTDEARTGTDVVAAAAHGTSGASTRLPFVDIIQRAFGRHDISNVNAHADGSAAMGAKAMGARAFATGNNVAFGASPDLHTAAHEAAHVVQQRGALQLNGGVGEAGDQHEAHANDVADRVVAGNSAEDLLDRYADGAAGGPSSTTASSARVQRQAVGAQPPQSATGTAPATTSPAPNAPAGAGPTAPAANEAYNAPTSARDPHAPAARNADWGQIRTAGTDTQAQQTLDIAWIDDLPTHLKNTIDQAFADSVAEAATAKATKTDSALKTIGKDIDKQEKDLETAAVDRLAATDPTIRRKHGNALRAALNADPTYAAAIAQLEADRARRVQGRTDEMRAAADGPMSAGSREDSVASPSTAKITRLEGKALARTNFMSWAVDVLGSTAAAKAHFGSMRQVSGAPGMYLVELAAARFEAARADFEAKHPGYSFPSTDVAQSLRGFHQARQGIGMLGHALGVAFDLLANDNPNQKLGEAGGNYGYLLDRMGGDGDRRGRSIMTLGAGGEDRVAQMGRDSAAHRSSPEDDAMADTIREQFEEMAATSERFKASMTAHLPELSEARDDYFNGKEDEAKLVKATADEKNAGKIADKRLKDEKFTGDDAARTARREEIKLELSLRKEELARAVANAKTSVKDKLDHAFADWLAKIEADLAATRARQVTSDAETAARTAASRELEAIDVRAPNAVDVLNAFADAHQLRKRTPAPRAAGYKGILKAELAAKLKPRADSDPLSPAYIRNEIAVLQAWEVRLKDPKQVFGTGRKQPAAATSSPAAAGPAPSVPATAPNTSGSGAPAAPAAPAAQHWGTVAQASNAPVMQFVEGGFIRNDAMPERQGARDKKQVFNAEVATTLARFGFSPGATYRDTMHFDFIEGYGAAPGGRSQANMNKTKYGPSGDLASPAPSSPATSTRGAP